MFFRLSVLGVALYLLSGAGTYALAQAYPVFVQGITLEERAGGVTGTADIVNQGDDRTSVTVGVLVVSEDQEVAYTRLRSEALDAGEMVSVPVDVPYPTGAQGSIRGTLVVQNDAGTIVDDAVLFIKQFTDAYARITEVAPLSIQREEGNMLGIRGSIALEKSEAMVWLSAQAYGEDGVPCGGVSKVVGGDSTRYTISTHCAEGSVRIVLSDAHGTMLDSRVEMYDGSRGTQTAHMVSMSRAYAWWHVSLFIALFALLAMVMLRMMDVCQKPKKSQVSRRKSSGA